ncbi:MAG: glutaredoxin family protein [Chloroflexi bacterium]|nr:glutaredoxin family protein [Chloroflexota bacterium]
MFCTSAKEYLSRKGIAFEDKDVTRDQAALKELQDLGYMTTPVIKIDGEVIVGFDRKRLDALLPNL